MRRPFINQKKVRQMNRLESEVKHKRETTYRRIKSKLKGSAVTRQTLDRFCTYRVHNRSLNHFKYGLKLKTPRVIIEIKETLKTVVKGHRQLITLNVSDEGVRLY